MLHFWDIMIMNVHLFMLLRPPAGAVGQFGPWNEVFPNEDVVCVRVTVVSQMVIGINS